MSEFKINDYILSQEAKEIITQGIIEEKEYGVPALEYAQQACDGHEWVIYTYKAILLCAECDTSAGEDYFEDCGIEFSSFGDHATKLAYATLLNACNEYYCEIN